MLEKVIKEFNKYTSSFDMKDKNINLKYGHSYAVSELMGELAFRLDLSKEEIELAKIIGLLHDIGRFEQLKNTNSFDDSIFEHAEYGADYLFKDGHIRDFLDIDKYDSIIEKAIRNHNKIKIVDKLSNKELLFTQMIRDMDKVDIYKQTAVKYEMSFNVDEVSSKLLEKIRNEKLIEKCECKSDSDWILLMLSYIYDINFNESFDILVSTDNFDLFLSTVDVSENSEKMWKKLKEICFDKINRGV